MSRKVVVIGLGYVGLPLAQAACHAGLDVTGLDISQRIVDGLNAGRSHVDDLSDAEIAAMQQAGFNATADASVLATRRARSTAFLNDGDTPNSVILSLLPFCLRS